MVMIEHLQTIEVKPAKENLDSIPEMDSLIDDCSMELRRYDWKQQFGWCHRMTPVLVTQSLLVLHVLKTGDVFFDVTGIVNFNLVLLLCVTSAHLLIWEIICAARNTAREKLNALDGYNNQILQDMTQMTRICISDLKTGLQKSKNGQRNLETDVEKAAGLKRKTSVGTQTPTSPPVSKEENLERGLSSFSLSSSSSSICVIPDASSSDSTSYCVLSSCSSLGSLYSSSFSGTFSDSCSSAADTDDSYSPLPDDRQLSTFAPSISSGTDDLGLGLDTAQKSIKYFDGGNESINSNRFPGIPMAAADGHVQRTDEVSMVPRAPNVNNRLRLLQDVYIVVDIFKSLVCLDALRHLWFYYSLYYWRITVFQMMQVFLVPSLVVLCEVSLTIVFYIP